MAKGKVVCIYGAKGGIGKSTFTLNLAGVISNIKKKVLILDFDLSNGAIACSLNSNINKTIFNFCEDYANNRFSDMENYINSYNENIDFISSPKDPRQANKIDIKLLDVLIDKCAYKYDCILIDTSYVLDEVNVFALDKSDNILFMTTNDIVALKNLKNVLNIMNDNDFKNYKIILNNSVYPSKDYFSLFDIKSILNNNIDYIISSSFYYKKMDNLIINGEIATLKYNNFNDYKIFELIANDVLKEGKDE